jgi:Peptidase_C39 like family
MAACAGVAPLTPNTAKVLKFQGDSAQLPVAKADNRGKDLPFRLGIRMKVGNSNNCTHGASSVHGGGGSGEKAKVGGGSGEKKMPPGLAKKGGSGEWMPPGLAKKFGDSWDSSRTSTAAQQGDTSQPSGGGILGAVGNFLSNLWGGRGSGYLGYQDSTPQAVAQKNSSSQAPVDLGTNPAQPLNARPLPPISQMDPTGKDANYQNAAMNCGPTVLAMIGDAYNKKPANMTDAQYISMLGTEAATTAKGTTGNGMIAALNDMGFQTAASKGADLNWINSQLQQGHEVIANGDFYSIGDHQDPKLVAGHYAAITAFNGTTYTVNDPANGTITQLTPQQLYSFITNHPEGGFTLATWPDPTATAAAPVG